MTEQSLPKDEYSAELSRLTDHPEAIISTSLVERLSFYGHTETWVLKTIRIREAVTLFLQRMAADGAPIRLVIPPDVSAAAWRQMTTIKARARSRGAIKAAATRKAAGVRPFAKKVS
jgi:hypothetical protein